MKTAAAIGLLYTLATGAAAQTLNTDPDSARIVTADIERFWRAYDRLGPGSTREDSVRAFSEGYLGLASPGLAAFDRMRLRGPDGLLFALRMLPRYYAAVRPNTLRLHEQEPVVRAALRRLEAVYPGATFPDVYFVVGGFSTQGTLSDAGLLIGAEMVSADASTPMDELPPFMRDVALTTEVIPCIVVHELVHHQQDYAEDRSLLAQSLVEGIADFVTDRAVGCRPTAASTYAWGEAHERELWAEFQGAMGGTDYGGWLYNGGEAGERPDNLGYWMGYQIAEAYYERAEDKGQAVYDLLHIQDYPALLEVSGYTGSAEE
jgi:hypothetical protein